jgi:O-antigen/teichoic acid export membrane protein
MSRTSNSARNLLFNTANQIVTIIFSFVVRTFLIKYLGEEYLGINGLFTSIISMLSLVELGIGTAIIYDLYKPLALKNSHKVLLLMNMYKLAYRLVSGAIFIIGLCILPFMKIIVKDDISSINIYVIFIIYMLQSVSSYLFFAYKSSLIRADQKEYIISKITLIFTIVFSLIQVILLVLFRNFTLYVLVIVASNILQNIIIAREADKLFPYINNKTDDKLTENEKRNIYKNCYATFIYKVNGVVLNATDNILLSTYIGLSTVGLYSNYVLISTAIKNILRMFSNSISASIGNLDVTETNERKKYIFECINFITFWIFGSATVGFFVLVNKFIILWIGSEYIFSNSIVLLISIDLLMFGMMKTTSVFRTSMGLFVQGKYRPLFGIIINLFISIYLVKFIDIAGVVLGTIVANILTYIWYDPLIIYKHAFKCSVRFYYFKTLKYICMIILSSGVSFYICSLFNFINIITFFLQGIICIGITGTIFYLFLRKTYEFEYTYNIIKRLIVNKFQKHTCK